MSIGGIRTNYSAGYEGPDDEGSHRVGAESDTSESEPAVVRGQSGPWGAGQPLDTQTQEILARLEEAEGKKPRILGFLDVAASVHAAGRTALNDRGFMSLLGTFTGSGGNKKLSWVDAENLIKAAKDFQRITKSEYKALADFVRDNGSKFEEPARNALVEFLRKHAPEDIARTAT